MDNFWVTAQRQGKSFKTLLVPYPIKCQSLFLGLVDIQTHIQRTERIPTFTSSEILTESLSEDNLVLD